MKSILTIAIFVIAFSMFAPMIVSADAPQPENWMYAAVKYTGLGSAQAVQQDFFNWQANYVASTGQVWTSQMWTNAYEAMVTQYLQEHGCSSCFIVNHVPSLAITTYTSVYLRGAGIKDAQTK